MSTMASKPFIGYNRYMDIVLVLVAPIVIVAALVMWMFENV
jgi:hypothetical protein